MAGAPKGNKNAAKKRLPWQQALKRSLTRYAAKHGEKSPNYRRGLDKVADQVVQDAVEGNKDAWMEIANRLEGKPAQEILHMLKIRSLMTASTQRESRSLSDWITACLLK